MKGKDKCKILKEIRKQIAEQNNIEWVTSECKHQGECKGTCPKCESEVRKLEKELEIRRKLGQTVAIAGLSVSVLATTTGCSPVESVKSIINGVDEDEIAGEFVEFPDDYEKTNDNDMDNDVMELEGDVACPEEDVTELDGDVVCPEENVTELDGDVAYIGDGSEEVETEPLNTENYAGE